MALAGLFPATAMPDREWWAALWPDPEHIVRTVGIEPDATAVDLGCGDGYFTGPLARLLDGRVYAIDLDAVMLDQAREEVARTGVPSPVWICGDAMDLATLIPQPVDLVWMANTFHGVPDKRGLVRAITRVLKPGGRFVVINWHRRPREETTVLGLPRGPRTELRLTPEDVRSIAEAEGLLFDKVVELPPYHYAAIFRTAGGAASDIR